MAARMVAREYYAGLGSGRDDVQVEDIYDARTQNVENPFHIEVRFLGGLTNEQKKAFVTAADKWASVIVGDLVDVQLPDGTIIDDVRIDAAGVLIDGPGRVLGRAGPTGLRPPEAGKQALLPYAGSMEFDVDDIPRMIDDDLWDDVIVHEMGHVIGMLDRVWSPKGFVRFKGIPGKWSFVGPTAMAEFGKLQDPSSGQALADSARGGGGPGVPVPIEDNFGPGTIGSHWRESVFGAEMMTGFINPGSNPLSRVTGGALADIGYQVDLDACDPYTLPSSTELAMLGVLSAARLNDTGMLGGYIEHTVPRVAPATVLKNNG